MNLAQEQHEVEQINFRLNHARQLLKREKAALREAKVTLQRSQEAQEILQHLAQAVQQKAHQRIAEVVSSCLATVFEDPYQLHIQFERKRGRTEAHLKFVRRGLEVDPLTASGGGAVDVAAFALRVACLVLHRPRLSRILILD